MKKFFIFFVSFFMAICSCNAYQVLSTKEFGKEDAKNQNVIVKCTTDTGKLSTQTCSLRRYAKCQTVKGKKVCNSWQPWRSLRDTSSNYSDWKTAASACCKAKGLR